MLQRFVHLVSISDSSGNNLATQSSLKNLIAFPDTFHDAELKGIFVLVSVSAVVQLKRLPLCLKG